MTVDILSVLIVISFGLFTGTGIGLVLGFLAKTQTRDWREMTRRQISINAGLVLACSAICIAGLAWYVFFR